MSRTQESSETIRKSDLSLARRQAHAEPMQALAHSSGQRFDQPRMELSRAISKIAGKQFVASITPEHHFVAARCCVLRESPDGHGRRVGQGVIGVFNNVREVIQDIGGQGYPLER
jgi:hypothetical protein